MTEKKLIQNIPEEQWRLPVGYSDDGKLITLKEYRKEDNLMENLDSLSGDKKKNLVVERIKLNDSYPTRFMVGLGEVNKEIALEEVIKESPAGKFIMESERNVIEQMMSEIQKK